MTDRQTVEFDHHSPAYSAEPWDTAARLATECPVAWSEHHGGFWVVAGHAAVNEAAKESRMFSSRHDLPTGSTPFQGVNLPPAPGRYLPIELDPPEQTAWRQAMTAAFSPAATERLLPLMRDYTTWCLDRCIGAGTIDFVHDFAVPVPAMVTLHLLGVPVEQYEPYADLTHRINHVTGEDLYSTFMAFDALLRGLVPLVHERRDAPRDDLLSVLARMKPNGDFLSDEDVASALGTIIAGGIDTTAGVVANALKCLDEQRHVRDRLIADPELIAAAVEEFLRYASPVPSLARTASTDVELGGQQIHAGDRMILMWGGANMDAAVFESPTEVKIDRTPNRHVAFGAGSHRCIGAGIARADIAVMISAVLQRLPDYALVPDGAVRYPSIGVSHNYIAMPATFTPGAVVGLSQERLAATGLQDA